MTKELADKLIDKLGNKNRKKSNFIIIAEYTILYLGYLGNLMYNYVSDMITPNADPHTQDKK